MRSQAASIRSKMEAGADGDAGRLHRHAPGRLRPPAGVASRQPAHVRLAWLRRDGKDGASRLRPADIINDAQVAGMNIELTAEEKAIAEGRDGAGSAMAMRIVIEAARLLGAARLIPIASAHID